MDHIHNNGLNNAHRAPGVLNCSSCSNCFVSNFPLFLGGLAIQQRVCATVSVLSPQEQNRWSSCCSSVPLERGVRYLDRYYEYGPLKP